MAATPISVRLETRAGDNQVAFVTLDRPEKANAMSRPLMAAFRRAMDDLTTRHDLRAVVLAGAGGRAFCGGADLDDLAKLSGEAGARAFIEEVHACCAAVRDCPAPVIAAVDGAALGAGLELAASCDLRLASETARFGMPEVRLGIPSVVEAALLPTLIGFGRARQMLLLGDTIDAPTALAWGLVSTVTPREGLAGAVEETLAAVLANGHQATRAQKRLIRAWEDLPLKEAIAAGVDAFAAAYRTEEPQAMMTAFLAARRLRASKA